MSKDSVLDYQEKSFSGKNVKVNFHAKYIKTLPNPVVYIKLNTNEKDLLFSLSYQFKLAKFSPIGCNNNNRITGCIVGENGIVINCPENKIVNIILQYIAYLERSTLKGDQFMCRHSTKGSYQGISKAIENFDVYIYGKCKTFIKNCILKQDASKMNNMIKSLETRTIKERGTVEAKEISMKPVLEKPISCNASEVMDLFFAIKDIDCMVSYESGSFQLYNRCANCLCALPWKSFNKELRDYLKSVRNVAGMPGSDPNKNKNILEDLNRFIYCYLDVRNMKGEFKNIEEVKKIESNSLGLIRQMCK